MKTGGENLLRVYVYTDDFPNKMNTDKLKDQAAGIIPELTLQEQNPETVCQVKSCMPIVVRNIVYLKIYIYILKNQEELNLDYSQ